MRTAFAERLSGVLLVAGLVVGTAHASSKLVAYGQHVPPIVSSSQNLGSLPAGQTIGVAVGLKADTAGLEWFCGMVSDPKSPMYRHFISPEEVGQRFGASQATVDATVAYLKSQGLKVTLVAKNRMVVSAEGTVSQIESAFQTKLAKFRGPAPDGHGTYDFRAFTVEPKLPETFASQVVEVDGLSTVSQPKHMSTTLTPALHKGLYDLNPIYTGGFTGAGRTVGVTNWGDGYKLSNIPLFYTKYSLPGNGSSNVHTVLLSGGSASHSAQGECDLDMQLELGQAPAADLYLYDDGSNGGNHLTMLTKEGNDNLCDFISESWGWSGVTGQNATNLHNAYLAMQAQGITYMCASGDSGARETFDYPAFDPAVLVIGGTVATCNTQTGVRVSEIGWAGSGGGYSNKAVSFNVLPPWQVGNGVPNNLNFRLYPDISGHASASGGAYFFYWNGSLVTADGTSLSSPSCAGSLAIVSQDLISQGFLPPDGNGKRRFGHMQELIYGMNGRSDAFFDVTSGNNGTLWNGQSSSCTAFWDTVTGWGCFDYNGFMNAITGGGGSNETVVPGSYTLSLGKVSSGDVNSLANDDGNSLVVCKFFVPNQQSPFVSFSVLGGTTKANPTAVTFRVKSKMNDAGAFKQTLRLYNWQTSSYEEFRTDTINLGFQQIDLVATGNVTRYVDGSGLLQSKIEVQQTGPSTALLPCASFELANWIVKG